MEKYLVSVEFRYTGKPDQFNDNFYTKTLTLGVFESFDEAIENGNKFLEKLELSFICIGNKSRFGKNNGPFRSKTTLVTDMGYLKTPFDFFAKITTLHFADQSDFVASILSQIK